MPEVQREIPKWLKTRQLSAEPRKSNRIIGWLLRQPIPSKTAWFLFLMGTVSLLILTILHINYSLRFGLMKEGGIFAAIYFLSFYGAELLPQRSRKLAAVARLIGIFAGLMLLISFVFGEYGLLWWLHSK
jgi:hypothetical protein